MKIHKVNKVVLASLLILLSNTAALKAAVLASYDAALAGAGNTPEDVDPAWRVFSNGPDMVNNGNLLAQNFTASQYGYYTTPTSLAAGTFNVGISDYGISARVQPISNIPFAGGSDYASILLEWQDNTAYYGLTFWVSYGVTYGPSGSGLFAVDWTSPQTVFVGYNHVTDQFSFYLNSELMTTQNRTTFILGSEFVGANSLSFGDATTGGTASQANWYNVSVYDSATPVPEPSTYAMLAALGLVVCVRRFLKKGPLSV